MEKIIRIGLDTSKSVFQVHGVNQREESVLKKRLRRSQLVEWVARTPPVKPGENAAPAMTIFVLVNKKLRGSA